jgi:hypothetical protein
MPIPGRLPEGHALLHALAGRLAPKQKAQIAPGFSLNFVLLLSRAPCSGSAQSFPWARNPQSDPQPCRP